MSVKPFFDTNIIVYAFGDDEARSEKARILLAIGGTISVQVLNELTSVFRKKLKLNWKDATEALDAVRTLCPNVLPITLETHDKALMVAQKYNFTIYDSLMIAAAIAGKTKLFYSEDLQDGQVIEEVLTIRNPFTRKN